MTLDQALRRILSAGQSLAESDVREFLALRVPEGLRLEYKEKVSDDSLVQAIAAMANTSGGVILVGVAEDRRTKLPLPEPPGVTLADRESLASKAFDRLEPTLDLEIEAVELSNGRYVLVIRIDDRAIEKPVVAKGRVYVRIEGHSLPAARQQILSMIPQAGSSGLITSYGGLGRNFSARGGSFGIVMSDTPGLAVRVAVGAEIPRWQATKPIRSRTRKALLKAVEESRFERWLHESADDGSSPGEWSLEGAWTSSAVALVRRRRRATVTKGWDVDAQVALDSPHIGGHGGSAVIYLDAAFLPQPLAQEAETPQPPAHTQPALSPPFRFFLPAFYGFVETLIAAATEDIGSEVFPGFLESDGWTRGFGPMMSIHAQPGPLGEYIEFGSFPRAREARNQNQTDFYATPADDVSDPEVRRALLVEWLELLFLNQGYYDFDRALEPLGRS